MTNNDLIHSLEIGTQLGDYTIQAILGRGAFGITYLAYDQNLNYLVAIKEYLPQELATRNKDNTVHPYSGEKESLFQYGLNSFLREAQTIAKFRHPNIVSIRGFFKENDTAYMVMEYEKGQTLKAYLEEHPNISEQRLLEIFCPINDGLLYVHKLNYIHRDIKPANIVIREDNTPVLIDFGTARDVLNNNSEDLTQIFTKGYAPVEQCYPKLAKQGPWTDIYALGATLYFAITGNVIISSKDRTINDIYQPLVDLAPYNQKYSLHFLKAIDDALSCNPDERPQDLEAWNNALKALRKEEKPVSLLASNILLASLATIIIVLIASLLYFYVFKTEGVGINNQVQLSKDDESEVRKLESSEVDQKDNIRKTTEETKAVENDLPDNLREVVETYSDQLNNEQISFNELTAACDNINKYTNQSSHTALRSLYIKCLESSLAKIPLTDLDDAHKEWLTIHENNIIRDSSKGYKLNPEVKEELLKNPRLYGTLSVKVPESMTLYLTIKQGNTCTIENPCEVSEAIKKIKLQSGETDISFSDTQKGKLGDGIVNIHPNQNHQLVLEY
jgi:serine/threonine protein kinase